MRRMGVMCAIRSLSLLEIVAVSDGDWNTSRGDPSALITSMVSPPFFVGGLVKKRFNDVSTLSETKRASGSTGGTATGATTMGGNACCNGWGCMWWLVMAGWGTWVFIWGWWIGIGPWHWGGWCDALACLPEPFLTTDCILEGGWGGWTTDCNWEGGWSTASPVT